MPASEPAIFSTSCSIEPIKRGEFYRTIKMVSRQDDLGTLPKTLADTTRDILKQECLPKLYPTLPWIEERIEWLADDGPMTNPCSPCEPMKKPKSTGQQGDSITDAYVQHESAIRRFIGKFLPRPNDIEDVSQEAFLKAFVAEKKHSIEQPKSFLFRVARNMALSHSSPKLR